MKSKLFIIVAALALAGCDAVTNKMAEMAVAKEPTIVLGSGFKIAIDGKNVPVFGFDQCPKNDAVMTKFFGDASDSDSNTCIVLSKDRQSVAVLVGLSNGRVTEQWAIIRETSKIGERSYSKTTLRRPDGSLVVPENIS